ncbi:MAG: hypothetical protein QNK24_14635 [Desulfuromusa sp.]|nr:hypothetical protein [Desulfuromusa sp.]
MNIFRMFSALLLGFVAVLLLVGHAVALEGDDTPTVLRILKDWRGDYPVAELHRLPVKQQSTPVGYLGDLQSFTDVWKAFKPEEDVPSVDFREQLVLFARNVRFFNRVSIAQVRVTKGVADVLVLATMSALPIEDKVSMALAVIPRSGVEAIGVDSLRIPVLEGLSDADSDPLNTTYIIEGLEVTLRDGRFERAVVPDSAIRTRVKVFGQPAFGDLDGDGDEDAAIVLIYHAGGSGTFYYVVAALNENGRYRGVTAVLLGDRIIPLDLEIRDSLVLAHYQDRAPLEPMSTYPTLDKLVSLRLKNGQLAILKPLAATEKIVVGWVTREHETY